MCLEITYLTIAKYPEIFFDAFKTGQNEKSDIFQEIGIQEIYVRLFENFQNLIAPPVWYLDLTNNMQKLVKYTA